MWSIWIPKIAAFLAAAVATYAAAKGLTLSETELTAIFLAVLGTVKTLVGRYTNPGNVNAKELVEPQKREVAEVRATQENKRRRGGF